jgi:predicted PurR-regulated permease PerM
MTENKLELHDNKVIELVAKVVLVALITYGSYLILKPFIGIVVWAIIIAITVNPIITIMENRIGWSRTKSSVIFTIAIIALILIPSIGLGAALSDTVQSFITQFKAGTLHLPAPSEKVASWPFVGAKIYPLWHEASLNLNTFILAHKEDLLPYVKSISSIIGSGIIAILSFIASMAIAAVFTSTSEAGAVFSNTLAQRLAGERGVEWVRLSVMTVRSVVQGVIGIALIQATVAYIGFVLFGIPLAVVLAFIIMLIAIAQLPALLVLIFPMIYMFSTASTGEAIGFSIFAIILGLSDNVLKPLLLGRGVDAPMLVILLGAIGGMIMWGILGLFIGSVLLAVTYKLFTAWLIHEAQEMKIPTEELSKLEV